MMKRVFVMLTLLTAVISLGQPIQAQTADEVRAKMIDAQGGKKVLEAIKDTTTIGAMEMPAMGISGTVTMYQKEPDKMRMDMEFMGMKITQAYDGKIAWITNPQTGKSEEIPEKAAAYFKNQAYGNDALLNPAKYGITYTFKEKVKVDDRDCLVLEQAMADGKKTTIFLDAATYLVYKTKSITLNQMNVETEAETIFADYRKVGGTLLPFSLTIKQGDQAYAKITLQEVTFNTGLEDTFFKMN